MGLFSTEKKVYVSSSVYNLAGEELKRPNYLKTALVGSILSRTNTSIGSNLTRTYLDGPGIKLRGFAQWSRNNGYNTEIGHAASSLHLVTDIDHAAVAAQIPHGVGETVLLQRAEIGLADYTYWVDRYMVENHPDLLSTAYTADFHEATNTITITLADGAGTVSFTPSDYDPGGTYLYASYNLVGGSVTTPVSTGPVVTLGSGEDFPSTDGWTLVSYSSSGSDFSGEWEKINFQGMSADSRLHSQRLIMRQNQTGSTRTYQYLEEDITHQSWAGLRVFIYRKGSGNAALDAQFTTTDSMGSFFPFIPVRVDNVFISESFVPEIYHKSKRALKKSIGGDYDEIVEKIADNPSLGDIDYAYITFGVSLNVRENACRRYIYEFFQEAMLGRDLTDPAYHAWRVSWEEANTQALAWRDWQLAQNDPGSPLYGTPEPTKPTYPTPPTTSVRVASNRSGINYDMTISWSNLVESVGSGLKKPDAKPGELWFEPVETDSLEEFAFLGGGNPFSLSYLARLVERVRLHWQVDANNWRTLDIYGLQHTNMVYGGKAVVINAYEALADAEESGFIIPLHEGVFKKLPITVATQMSTACCFLVFNCYKVVKQKWYQTGWFKIILIVAMVAITIATGGLGASTTGLLGTNIAVGTAVGFTGMAAIIAGAVINYIAAMVLTQIIGIASTAIFGKEVGAIISAVVSFIAVNVGVGLSAGMDFSAAFNNIFSVENLLKLTSSVGDGISGLMQANLQDVLGKTQELLASYNEQSRQIRELHVQNLGMSQGAINPFALTDVSLPVVAETPASFLGRTLLTGSDIANMTNDLLSNFASLTLSTDLPA